VARAEYYYKQNVGDFRKVSLSYTGENIFKMATVEGSSKFQYLLHIMDQPFENIAAKFKGLVPEQERFEAACALMALLEDGESQVCLVNKAI
jgi:hypothetical protein